MQVNFNKMILESLGKTNPNPNVKRFCRALNSNLGKKSDLQVDYEGTILKTKIQSENFDSFVSLSVQEDGGIIYRRMTWPSPEKVEKYGIRKIGTEVLPNGERTFTLKFARTLKDIDAENIKPNGYFNTIDELKEFNEILRFGQHDGGLEFLSLEEVRKFLKTIRNVCVPDK